MEHDFDSFSLDDIIKEGKKLHMKVNTSREFINNLIAKLKAEVEKENPSFTLLEDTCYDLICRLPIPIHLFENTFVLRARPNEPQLFSKQSEISYNSEKPHLIKLQRFNLDEEQVFYCAAPIDGHNANGTITTISESFKEIFDEKNNWQRKSLTIGKWNIQKSIKLLSLAFYDRALNKSFHLQNIVPPFQMFLDEVFDIEDQEKCRLFYGFFSQCAGKTTDTRNNYLLTTAFYHAVRKYYGEEVGILYSSASTENYGINIVLSKKIIDSDYLNLDSVVVYELFKNPFNEYRLFALPTMLAFVNGREDFKLKRMTPREMDLAILKRNIEQGKDLGWKLGDKNI
jgi:hypothetical protein